jgi:predicted phosphoribosyltransferase
MLFRDRRDAGRRLAAQLLDFAGQEGVTVLALPRGGVPIGFEIARALSAPFDVFVVRKLGVPGHEELAMGAIASGGARVVDRRVTHALRIPAEVLEEVACREQRELERSEITYRHGRPLVPVRDRIVILVDDGLATGSSMRAAVAALRDRQPDRIVVAVPVGSRQTCHELRNEVDEVRCLATPEPFRGVGIWYDHFEQTSDDEVRRLLALAGAGEADANDLRN